MNLNIFNRQSRCFLHRIPVRTLAVPGKSNEKTPKGGRKGQKDTTGERKMLDSMYLLAMSSEKAKKYKPHFPPDVAKRHAEIGREYNRQTTIINNKRDKDLQTKCYLQHEAMECLRKLHTPTGEVHPLYTAAMTLDPTPPPPDRPFPMWDTPPIKEFDVKEYLKKEAADNVGKESSQDFL